MHLLAVLPDGGNIMKYYKESETYEDTKEFLERLLSVSGEPLKKQAAAAAQSEEL